MTLGQQLRSQIRKSALLRAFVGHVLVPSGILDERIRGYELDEQWQERLRRTLAAPDNAFIPRVPGAGAIKNGKQTMHNGLKINLGSYYGPEVSQILLQNKGVHEPQEERVFQEVLKQIPVGATMLELGAFWSFYSMWFHQVVKDSRNLMVEPEAFNLKSGENNFKLNGMKGTFIRGFVGDRFIAGAPQTVSVDHIVETQGIDRLHLLHSDIQGYEVEMIAGARKTLDAGKVDFIFISTHSNAIHATCLAQLNARKFHVIAEYNLDQSFSEDGMIAAAAPHTNYRATVDLSRRTQ